MTILAIVSVVALVVAETIKTALSEDMVIDVSMDYGNVECLEEYYRVIG